MITAPRRNCVQRSWYVMEIKEEMEFTELLALKDDAINIFLIR